MSLNSMRHEQCTWCHTLSFTIQLSLLCTLLEMTWTIHHLFYYWIVNLNFIQWSPVERQWRRRCEKWDGIRICIQHITQVVFFSPTVSWLSFTVTCFCNRLVIFIIHAQIIFKFLYLLCGIFYRGNKFTDLLQLALDICCKPERANWIRNELKTKTESISTNRVSFIPCELSLCITHTYPILFEEVPCSRKCVTDVVEKMWSLWARLPTIRHITAWCTDNSCSHSCLACCLFYD